MASRTDQTTLLHWPFSHRSSNGHVQLDKYQEIGAERLPIDKPSS
jgi:hypothetical protein